jgi:hypothetical protein
VMRERLKSRTQHKEHKDRQRAEVKGPIQRQTKAPSDFVF